jgi:dTDP-4-amino-4,6-dideoxygalactose transaminase
MTTETIAAKVTPKTRVIVVVHLYGYGADMPGIMRLAKKHNLLVVEDAAQSLGVDVGEKRTGVFGDIGVFSFHSHKNITTLGEGGAITVASDEMASIIPMLRHNGHSAFDYEREDYWIPAMGDLKFPQLNGDDLWPNNFCMGEIECALGIKLLDRIDEINQEKRKRALRFIDALGDFPELEWHRVDSSRHNYHLLVARMSNGRRDEFIRKMAHEKWVQCVVQYYPLNRYPLYKKAGYGKAECPSADDFFDNMVSFPFHHEMTNEELDYSLQSICEVLKEMKK